MTKFWYKSSEFRNKVQTRNQSYDDTVSVFEMDGSSYTVSKHSLGQGIFAMARDTTLVLAAPNSEPTPKVVLSPNTTEKDFKEEARTKLSFFQKMYPTLSSKLIILTLDNKISYRLILPKFPFPPLKNIPAKIPEAFLFIFLSAVRILNKCHSLNLIYMDISNTNILYDEKKHQSYLIDGGHSLKKNQPLHSIYKVENSDELTQTQKEYPLIAPECFYIKTPPTAQTSMDVFSLGAVMSPILLKERSFKLPLIAQLLYQCIAEEPAERPSLETLEIEIIKALNQFVPTQFKEQPQIKSASQKTGWLSNWFSHFSPPRLKENMTCSDVPHKP